MNEDKKFFLRKLPKIDEVMLFLSNKGAFEIASRGVVRTACRHVVEEIRKKVIEGNNDQNVKLPSIEEVADRVMSILMGYHQYRLRRVINATGVILHTNLGRAPLCPEAIERIIEVAAGYSNLEFDLESGKRGIRYNHVKDILCELSGAEDALVVNNNAAAVFLVLNTFSKGKESIVSRGELVEIGGEFRIPEIMDKSGACLREVGTTNRTRLSDYEQAIGPLTGLLMKVHTSNFKVVGFTEQVEICDLVALGGRHNIPVINDLGSGCFAELDRFGLEREPTVVDVIKMSVDVVTFSGDKLLGGPQAGIILGKKKFIEQIKKNPLTRALRIDKLTLAALEGTLVHYLQPEKAVTKLMVLRALTEPLANVKKRAKRLIGLLKKNQREGMTFSIKEGYSLAGGGSLPDQKIPTSLISIKTKYISSVVLEERLRHLEIPIISRILEEEVLLDLRTIASEEFSVICDGLRKIDSTF